jgi:NAD/NADP transhydrogenase beta subunit
MGELKIYQAIGNKKALVRAENNVIIQHVIIDRLIFISSGTVIVIMKIDAKNVFQEDQRHKKPKHQVHTVEVVVFVIFISIQLSNQWSCHMLTVLIFLWAFLVGRGRWWNLFLH